MCSTRIAATPERLALPAAELAKLLDISERHLWAMHASGQLGPRPAALGRSKRWVVDEVRSWLAAGAPPRIKWEEIKASALFTS